MMIMMSTKQIKTQLVIPLFSFDYSYPAMGLCAECFLLLEDTQKSLGLESFEPVCHYETMNVVLVVVETGGGMYSNWEYWYK